MAINRITIKQEDKYLTVLYPHYTDAEPKGSVLILHGMAEHHERYQGFASYLNANGYDVFLYDHRGHGLDKKFEDLGYFGEHDGYKKVICDAIQILKYLKKENRGEKLVLFGHSMGSMIARNVIQYYDAVDCCIICGTSCPAKLITRSGLFVSSLVRLFKGARHQSPFLDKLTTGGKNYTKISTRTAYDWLTRDNNIVGAYIHDPYCGFICSASFYHDLIKMTHLASLPKMIKRTRRSLPIFIISGSNDPVGSFGNDIDRLYSMYQKYSFLNVDSIIYEECRHELLNELNSTEIMKDIVDWIDAITVSSSDEAELHVSEPVLQQSKDSDMDEDEVLNQIRSTMALAEPEETEGEKKLATLRARKQSQKKQASAADNEK